jgi:hypothetical protein
MREPFGTVLYTSYVIPDVSDREQQGLICKQEKPYLFLGCTFGYCSRHYAQDSWRQLLALLPGDHLLYEQQTTADKVLPAPLFTWGQIRGSLNDPWKTSCLGVCAHGMTPRFLQGNFYHGFE